MKPYRVVFQKIENGFAKFQHFEVEAESFGEAGRMCNPDPGYTWCYTESNTEEDKKNRAEFELTMLGIEAKRMFGWDPIDSNL